MDDVIVRLAQNIVDTGYEKLSRETVDAAKKAVLDTLGVIIAGAPDCRREVELVREWGGKEESTILFHGGKVPAPAAAWVNGVMASACDYDGGMGAFHETASIIPAALAASEIRGATTGKDLITAVILGEDLAVRITQAGRGGGVHERNNGFHQGGIIAVFGAAAAAAKILDLDLNGVLNALGIAFIRAAGTHQVAADKVLAVRLTGGFVSRSGVEAAVMAQKGLTGVRNVMQGAFGFFRLFGQDSANIEALADRLGEKFPSEFHTKLRPHCGTTQAATEAALRLARENVIDPREISQITVDVSPDVYLITGQPFRLSGNPRVEGQFHLAYTIASALVRKDSKLEYFTDEAVCDPEVVELAYKVHPVPNTNIPEPLAAHLEIIMKDGRKYTRYDNLFPQLSSTGEINRKFRESVAFGSKSLAEKNAGRIIETVDRLEELDDVSELIRLTIEG